MQNAFTSLLIEWNQAANTRCMPWKGETNPYRIWLSEIILQQTRVDQGLAYYQRFVEKYPTIRDLAMAQEDEVYKLWEGLGYYSRCRNLLATARFIAFELEGRFPHTYEEILRLKGVGPYTAAAIASFAYGLPFAVLDGNVFRVLSRYFGITTPVDSPAGKKLFEKLANACLDTGKPGTYNQAIMDFGAVVCKPQLPLCNDCILRADCQAFTLNAVNSLPVKAKSITIRHRYFYYFILSTKNGVYIRPRLDNDIWQRLHEFLLIEKEEHVEPDPQLLLPDIHKRFGNLVGRVLSISSRHTQQLSHQKITGYFIHFELDRELPADAGFFCVPAAKLRTYAFPRFITRYMEGQPQ